MFDYTGKILPGTNTLAYLALSSATKEKSFITLTYLALPVNVSLGRKRLPVTNTLAYLSAKTRQKKFYRIEHFVCCVRPSSLTKFIFIGLDQFRNVTLGLFYKYFIKLTRGQCYKTNTAVMYCHFRLNCGSNIYNIEFTVE
jgi:hypothetical protein